jgi:hypothetical protein
MEHAGELFDTPMDEGQDRIKPLTGTRTPGSPKLNVGTTRTTFLRRSNIRSVKAAALSWAKSAMVCRSRQVSALALLPSRR